MDRRKEWFVPKFGPEWFRIGIGLLFLPYTGMVLSYTIIGSMLAPKIDWYRVVAILVGFFFALGIGAHSLDALGSKGTKPWGTVFSTRALWIIAIGSILITYCIALYYIILDSPRLWVIAVLEGFLLFAYNLEWFEGQFHNDLWFLLSWGFLPTLAGYILQTNRLSYSSVVAATGTAVFSYVEISASRPYKKLKLLSSISPAEVDLMNFYEITLKSVSFGMVLIAVAMIAWRWND